MNDPRDTVVVAVGISSYDLGVEWRLPKAAEHALEFALWACSCGVPADRVHLFLSRADAQHLNPRIVQAGLKVRRATLGEVVTSFLWTELTRLHGDLLYMFWSGHGSLSEDSRRVLFCEDVSLASQVPFDLNDFFARLRSSSYQSFGRQIAFIDACANRFEELGFDASLGQLRSSKGRSSREALRQQVFLAADAGEQAKEGAFGSAILRALGDWSFENSGHWPVDQDAIVDNVRPQFEHAAQRPVRLVWTTAEGDEYEVERTSGELPASRFVNAAAAARALPVRALRRLAGIALDFAELSNHGADGARQRDALYAALLAATNRTTAPLRRSTPEIEMLHLVGAAFQWDQETLLARELGQLAPAAEFSAELRRLALIQDARALIGKLQAPASEIQIEYLKTIRRLSNEAPREHAATVDAMLDELYQVSSHEEPQRALWEFLMRLADRYPKHGKDIQAFIGGRVVTPDVLVTLRNDLERERQFVLSINLVPADTDEPALAAIDAKLVVETTASVVVTFNATSVTSWNEANARAAEIVRECRAIVMQQYQRGEAALLVEFLLPAVFIERTPDDLLVRVAGMEHPLGRLHPVVVRLRERIAQRDDALNVDEWLRVSSQIDREKPAPVQWMDETRASPTLDNCNGLVALRFLPADDLIEIVSAGFPFMAWLRSEPKGGDWTAFGQAFEAWVGKAKLKELAREVRAIRKNALLHNVGLTLFWDDPGQTGHWPQYRDVIQGGQ